MLEEVEEYNWHIESVRVSEVFQKISSKELILRPEYQRRSVWPETSKSSFIESLIINVPIPLFLLNLNPQGQLEVVDGQQRLSSIYTYIKDTFKLTKLDKLDFLKGNLFSELPPEIQSRIESHQLLFAIVQDASEEQIIDMYYRSNKFTVNLNPQELRYAYYKNSNFKDLVVSISEGENGHEGLVGFFLQATILRESNVNRMADLEFTSELLALLLYKRLQDKKKVLDTIYDEFYMIHEHEASILTEKIHQTIDIIKHIFSANIFMNGHSLRAEKAISLTRFKQKNDFYSLFYVIAQLLDQHASKLAQLLDSKRDDFAAFLKIMDEYVSPEADIEIFSNYAIKCVSQANTRRSREYRSKFILEGIQYILHESKIEINLEHEDISFIENFEKQTNQLFSEFGFGTFINMQTMSFIEIHNLLEEFYNEE